MRRRQVQPTMIRTAALLLPLLAGAPALATAAPQAAGTRMPEPLSLALQERHVAAADLGGREVFDDEETRIGVMHVLPVPAPGGGSARFLIELSPALGIGEGCITAPLGWMREAPERRLLLHVSPRTVMAATREPCRPRH